MVKPGTWKLLAVLFMTLFVIETLFIIYSVKSYDNDLREETECYNKSTKASSFYYEYSIYTKDCLCYDEYGDIIDDFRRIA